MELSVTAKKVLLSRFQSTIFERNLTLACRHVLAGPPLPSTFMAIIQVNHLLNWSHTFVCLNYKDGIYRVRIVYRNIELA